MAHAEPTPAISSGEDRGWTTEVELRRYIRSQVPEGADTIRPIEPDPARAEHFDPDAKSGDVHPNDRYCYNDYLKEIEWIDVYDDRVVVPRESVAKLRQRDGADGYDDGFNELVNGIIESMRVVEGDGWWCLPADENGRPRNRTTDPTETDPRPVYIEVPAGDDMDRLQQLYEQRRRDGRTLLAVIVARDAATGTGKTTLAVQLAKSWDQNGWTADRATLDPAEYSDQYTAEDTPKQSVLLLDEAEQAADNRRSMSGTNIELSHLWATMRYREIYSLVTLPSASMLDKRLKELADLKIVVHERGTAVVYTSKIDDHSGEYRPKRLCRLKWGPLDDDPEYQRLTQMKADHMEDYTDRFRDDDGDGNTPDPTEIRKGYRRDVIEQMAAEGHTQQEIADALPDISDRSTVSKILNS